MSRMLIGFWVVAVESFLFFSRGFWFAGVLIDHHFCLTH
jgi:hypothetical protein